LTTRRPIVDAGPLVAFLNPNDRHHEWAAETLGDLEAPLQTCEAVLTEASHLLRQTQGRPGAVVELVDRGLLALDFKLAAQALPVSTLIDKYADQPMSLADACLVRMVELLIGTYVITLDRDFQVYRKNGRQVIPTVMPPGRQPG